MKILYRYPTLIEDINKKCKELTEILQQKDEFLEQCPQFNMGLHANTNTPSDPTFNTVYGAIKKYEAGLKSIRDILGELFETKKRIDIALLHLSKKEAEIISMTYFQCKNYQEICRKLFICKTTYYNLRQNAINIILKYTTEDLECEE